MVISVPETGSLLDVSHGDEQPENTLSFSPYCRHDNAGTMSVRVQAVARKQKAVMEGGEEETDGAERGESSLSLWRLFLSFPEFDFIVKLMYRKKC